MSAGKEPWDHERFVETYNALAQDRSGWYCVAEDSRTANELEQRYHTCP